MKSQLENACQYEQTWDWASNLWHYSSEILRILTGEKKNVHGQIDGCVPSAIRLKCSMLSDKAKKNAEFPWNMVKNCVKKNQNLLKKTEISI